MLPIHATIREWKTKKRGIRETGVLCRCSAVLHRCSAALQCCAAVLKNTSAAAQRCSGSSKTQALQGSAAAVQQFAGKFD